ncbi:FYVE zinc finger-domain-containing protein [Mycena amicta]|nr:FYVE zinc finger-domain-containing protein [Mycena amicta]
MTDNAPSNVPYQAYRSKRHSNTPSNPPVRSIPNGSISSEKDNLEISKPQAIDIPLPIVVLNPSPPTSPSPPASPSPSVTEPALNGASSSNGLPPSSHSRAAPGASTSTSVPDDRPRKTSYFPSSDWSAPSLCHPSIRPYAHQRPMSVLVEPQDRIPSLSSSPSRPSVLSSGPQNRRHSTPLNADAVAASLAVVVPPQRTSSLQATAPASISRASSADSLPPNYSGPVPSSIPSSPSTLNPPTPPRQSSAPYRPGFQPKGFISHRQAHAVSAGYASAERTKLERRLEKLIALHFPEETRKRPGLAQQANQNRRASSFFDLDIKSILSGGKDDIRSAEQRITPWQDDSTVTKCPLCVTNFHPLTNRKHHCRLCGQIICALPIKRPQRPQLCSVLFVVDPQTREVEEVGEGVDYGVRKRKTSTVQPQDLAEEEKFLRGVRICNECRPVLLRQQYYQQVRHVPTFVKLYEAFVMLEREIEDSLPQFQELILTLNHDSQPTKDASAARKRLLEAFAQYDSIAKRIRNLPTPNGGSQDRVQIAVMTRANLFLQKNMFPLQSLPTPKRANTAATAVVLEEDEDLIDPSSATALALQPLLEQEALLEAYVEEAKAQRKFEDAKTLRVNLGEIRGEIERLLATEGLKGRVRKAR